MTSSKRYRIVKWLIMVSAYAYLIYKLATFQHYADFAQQWQTHNTWFWLIATLALLPLNWLLEAYKWKYTIAHLEHVTLSTAITSTLNGITTGFFTPNRIGDYPGRSLLLQKQNRIPSIAIGYIGSIAQDIIICICGIPASILFFLHKQPTQLTPQLWATLFLPLALLLSIYLLLPRIAKKLLQRNTREGHYRNTLIALTHFTSSQLLYTLLISLARYAVYCTQLYCTLRFFSVQLSPWQAAIAIAANYLFITITPALAFSEIAIRGSYAIIFIGAFTPNLIGVSIAGMGLWLINYCIPMVIGSFTLSRTKISPTDTAS